ncbi:outer envelope protein [Acinetobacter puyangensis]|uniref:outer envelope protein n=1 Tax=Acinetobacter puyangensis TaxID=1096779 RepID=UPI003A4E5EB4
MKIGNFFSPHSLMIGALTLIGATAANAATWSDTSVGWRYGTKFAEPYKNNADGSRIDITKQIFNLTHVSGYKYGSNFFNVDLLQSNDEPNPTQTDGKGTQEAYVVYRHTLDIGKVLNKDLSYPGVIRGYGLVAGLDWNTKNDSYSSKKRMWVVGPTVMFDVPGFLNFSVLALFESNDPAVNAFSPREGGRYTYDTHPALQLTWGIPIGDTPLSFEGFALWIADKGKNEYGGDTKAETNIDAMVMYDLSSLVGKKDKTFRAGFEYQYWKNKFGNDEKGGAGEGATASTPMLRVDYHF